MNLDALTRDIIIEKLGFKTGTERLELLCYDIHKNRATFDAIGDAKEEEELRSSFRGASVTYHMLRKCGFFETL